MGKPIRSPKTISDPVLGSIDIRPILPIVSTRQFQLLSGRHQLGATYVVFPSATHSRLAHSIGVYQRTRGLVQRLVDLNLIDSDTGRAVEAYAACHDLGHGPYSHLSEAFFKPPGPSDMSVNSRLSVLRILEIRSAIESCGVDPEKVLALARHEDPRHQIVSCRNLGADKRDYLERDGLVTIRSAPVGLDFLEKHIYLLDGKVLAIDEKAADHALDLQMFYLKMYKNVYLRMTSAIVERMLQKTIYYLLSRKELEPHILEGLTDSELIGRISFSENPDVQYLYERFRVRNLFKEAFALRPEEFVYANRRSTKHRTTVGVPREVIERLAGHPKVNGKSMYYLDAVEREIARLIGIPETSVVILGVSGSEKFKPQDIPVYNSSSGLYDSLQSMRPEHFESLVETARSQQALRVCVAEEFRARASSPKYAKLIQDHLLGIVQTAP
ncbi:MAG: hypothetical protein AAB495_04000 [Patescibacteria group bacterium]|mgnify:CR=1 FL=1